MDTLPDLDTFALFGPRDRAPEFDRIAAALVRSEAIAIGLAEKFPQNQVFADHLAATRAALALVEEARAAEARGDRVRCDEIAVRLAGLFTARGKSDRLAGWGLLPG